LRSGAGCATHRAAVAVGHALVARPRLHRAPCLCVLEAVAEDAEHRDLADVMCLVDAALARLELRRADLGDLDTRQIGLRVDDLGFALGWLLEGPVDGLVGALVLQRGDEGWAE